MGIRGECVCLDSDGLLAVIDGRGQSGNSYMDC